ncbi:unnamed protein product [Rotaria sp. Silwood1]|nr:unnamed protein product [Rotaria sp. Silwood1]
MATVNESNACSICKKPSIKYFCIGCKQHFCPKDFKGHEQQLSIKFDNEIVRSHDELLDQIQKLEKSNNFSSDLFTQIEEWKKTTINKIEKAAEKAHHELIELIHKQRIKIRKQLETITKEIRCRREEENFLENDIVRLKQNLNEIQETLQQLFRKDTNKAIIVDNDQIDWNRLIYIREEQQTCESHDELLNQIQKLEKSNNFSSDLVTQIEEWKKTTINKIEKAAEKAHHELIELIHKQRIKIRKQLETITKEIRCRREEENFLENDIVRLKQNLNEIQETLQQLFRKDTNKAIIVDNDQIDWNRLIYIREEQQTYSNRLTQFI